MTQQKIYEVIIENGGNFAKESIIAKTQREIAERLSAEKKGSLIKATDITAQALSDDMQAIAVKAIKDVAGNAVANYWKDFLKDATTPKTRTRKGVNDNEN